jgi:DNA-binding response OmpR family regulator
MTMQSPARVLIVMDRPLVAKTVALTLDHGLFLARVAPILADAAAAVSEWLPNLAIVDMDLGSTNFLNELRLRGTQAIDQLPVIGLTRRGDLKTKLDAFDQGVDDILTVPFSPEELLARVIAIMRRTYGERPSWHSKITMGEIEIDILNRSVRAGTSDIHLSGLEQSLLYVLAANAGRTLTRDEILDSVWGTDFIAESNVVDRHIRALRIKLQNDWRSPRFIATVPGVGYRFVAAFSDVSHHVS